MRIGIFDSGIGGLTVLSELHRRFRDADFVYLGDTANVPYGPKSTGQIERLSGVGSNQE
jgi:glutamate racemase